MERDDKVENMTYFQRFIAPLLHAAWHPYIEKKDLHHAGIGKRVSAHRLYRHKEPLRFCCDKAYFGAGKTIKSILTSALL